jgi:hypothetical protein
VLSDQGLVLATDRSRCVGQYLILQVGLRCTDLYE